MVDTVGSELLSLGHTSSALVWTRPARSAASRLLSSLFVSVSFQHPRPQLSGPEPQGPCALAEVVPMGTVAAAHVPQPPLLADYSRSHHRWDTSELAQGPPWEPRQAAMLVAPRRTEPKVSAVHPLTVLTMALSLRRVPPPPL